MSALVHHYLPGQPVNDQTMGEAIWLEKRQHELLSNAVASGINKVL